MSGSLVCVGIGMKLGAHISPICRSHIEKADVVFSGVSDGIVELWLKEMHPDVRSLQVYYAEGKNRKITYNQVVEAMLTEVRAGKKVVGAFYGHPGVFAWAPHKSIQLAKEEGYQAYMEPGISAEDCLVADLGIDPGKFGCQQYEASQFMFYKRQLDPSAYLILWQIGVAGDRTFGKFDSDNKKLALLVNLLANDYPRDHQVILYEAAVLPIDTVRAEHIALSELPTAELHQHTTLVIPPAKPMEKNQQLLDQIQQIDNLAAEPC